MPRVNYPLTGALRCGIMVGQLDVQPTQENKMLEMIIKSAELDLDDSIKRNEMYENNLPEIKRVARHLKDVSVLTAYIDNDSVNLNITGDYAVLKAIFHAFREAGYFPSDRPNELKQPSFSCYFNRPDHDFQFWVNFSSTVCKRVQIGTEMKEVPIYETVCE